MREFKFRSWNNGFVFFDLIEDNDCDFYRFYCSAGDIVEQYTGLKDKNGKEIYEGDIVEKCYNKAKKLYSSAPVEFKHGKFESGGWTLCKFAHKCDIIGNIHENPELMKGE